MAATDFATLLIYAAVAFIGFSIVQKVRTRSRATGMRDLQGPPADSLLWGCMPSIRESRKDVAEWPTKYGKTFAVKVFMGTKRLYTVDPRVLAYVLSHPNEFRKSRPGQTIARAIAGPGLVGVDGDDHKRQRKLLNPAFNQAQIREYMPLFIQKADQLRDIWSTEVSEHGGGSVEINVVGWLIRVTLDIIGEAGFGYDFHSLQTEDNELAKAFHGMFATVASFSVFESLRMWIPAIGNIPTARNLALKEHTATLRRISETILNRNQRLLDNTSEGKEGIQGKDLLSVLLKSNIGQEAGSGLSHDEVIAQIATFTVAGHETTSSGLSWTLYALAKAPDVQRKLRQELMAFPHGNPSTEDLNGLTYLDWVVREALRVHAPAELMSRQAQQDEVIPLSDPIVNKHGQQVTEIHLKKGEIVMIHAPEINKSRDIWGLDAREFRPERWEAPPPAASAIPSVYSNLMTFLAGNRACIGWRMAVIEMKAFLFVFIRSLVFDIDPELRIGQRLGFVVARPFIEGRNEDVHQLPLKISFYQEP